MVTQLHDRETVLNDVSGNTFCSSMFYAKLYQEVSTFLRFDWSMMHDSSTLNYTNFPPHNYFFYIRPHTAGVIRYEQILFKLSSVVENYWIFYPSWLFNSSPLTGCHFAFLCLSAHLTMMMMTKRVGRKQTEERVYSQSSAACGKLERWESCKSFDLFE